MRLFFYYVLHSFVNQIRKLLKTWVLIFILACAVMGGVIGYAAGSLIGSDEEESAAAEESAEESPENEALEEAVTEFVSGQEVSSVGLSAHALLELAAGGLILIIFLFEIYGADKSGSSIFLPADVNLLFPSPMKPQSVLLFRLMTKISLAIFISLYFLAEIRVLVADLGLSAWSVMAVVLTWFLILVTGKLLQIFLYTLCSTHAGLKKYIRRGVYAVVLVLAALYAVYWRQSGLSLAQAADRLFNQPFTRWIPLWGWLKGFCMFIIEGRILPGIICAVLIAVSVFILIHVIWHMKADFYEDAMAKTEEMAELLDAAQSSESGRAFLMHRGKDRSEKLRRDSMNRGQGASVFFYKSVYNRFRFAHLGWFTKTSETYLVAAVGISLLYRFVLIPGGHGGLASGLTLVSLVIAGFAFFRSLGNPLGQDTEMAYFRIIPESSFKKLFFSLAGGTLNCLLDVLTAMIPACLILGASPVTMLAWVVFIVSVDFYATIVGTFIDLSVPVSAGKMLKQMAQIMFIYFGLIPDAALLFVGNYLGRFPLFALIATLVNLAIGFIFLSLSPLFLDSRDRPYRAPVTRTAEELKVARRHFSLLGFGPFMVLVITTVLQFAAVFLLQSSGALSGNDWLIWVLNFAPMYLIAVPIGVLIMRKVPETKGETRALSLKNFLSAFCICVFLMYSGSIIGVLVNLLVNAIIPHASAGNPLESLISSDTLFWRVLVIVVLAPAIEEFLFRRQLIDRMRAYGEKRAVILSALMFGLFHGNFSQMFYAFLLGLVLGYVYLRTGRLRYTIALHMIINFMGSVIAPALLESLDLNALETMSAEAYAAAYGGSFWLILVYFLLLVILFFTGLVLLCLKSREVHFEPAPMEIQRKQGRVATCNAGMILFLLGCLALVVISLV